MLPPCRTAPWRPEWSVDTPAARARSSSWCSWRPPSCTTHSPSTDPASARWGSWRWTRHSCLLSSWAAKWPRWHRGRPGEPRRTPGSEWRRTAWLSPLRSSDGALGRSWQQIIPQNRLQWAATRGEMRSEVSVGAWRTHSWGCWWCCVVFCAWSSALVTLQLMWWSLTLNYVHLKLQRPLGIPPSDCRRKQHRERKTQTPESEVMSSFIRHQHPERVWENNTYRKSEETWSGLTCVEPPTATPEVISEDEAETSCVNENTGCVWTASNYLSAWYLLGNRTYSFIPFSSWKRCRRQRFLSFCPLQPDLNSGNLRSNKSDLFRNQVFVSWRSPLSWRSRRAAFLSDELMAGYDTAEIAPFWRQTRGKLWLDWFL